MPRVSHPVSLQKNYQFDAVRPDAIKPNGQRLQASKNGQARVALSKGYFKRLYERMNRTWKMRSNFVMWSSEKMDRVKNQRTEQFNVRHKKFSARMSSMVGTLKQKGKHLDDRDETFKTLRNDMRLLWDDNTNVGSERDETFKLLQSRLDIELDTLSDEELKNFTDNLVAERDKLESHYFSGTRHGNDIRMLDEMITVALTHKFARSKEMLNTFDMIKNAKLPYQEVDVLNQSTKMLNSIRSEFQTTMGRDDEQVPIQMLRSAVRLGLARTNVNPKELSLMNTRLLNAANTRRKELTNDKNFKGRDPNNPEVREFAPGLRAINRAVREELLLSQFKKSKSRFRDDQAVSRFTRLGKGAAHTVLKTNYQAANPDGQSLKVYKNDDECVLQERTYEDQDGNKVKMLVGFTAPEKLGIDQTSPGYLERSVATSEFDKALGFGVIADTNYAVHKDELGMVMELAKGKPAKDTSNFNSAIQTDRGQVQQKLVQLQVLDLLTGQADRHHSNYFIGVDQKQVSVTGIDSDVCLGPNQINLNGYHKTRGIYLPTLPPVIDSTMKASIDRMTHQDIERIMGGKFSDQAIESAKDRLTTLKIHCRLLEEKGKVIDPKEWGTPKADDLLLDLPRMHDSIQYHQKQILKERQNAEKEMKKCDPIVRRYLRKWKIDPEPMKKLKTPQQRREYIHNAIFRRRRNVKNSDLKKFASYLDRLEDNTQIARVCTSRLDKISELEMSLGQTHIKLKQARKDKNTKLISSCRAELRQIVNGLKNVTQMRLSSYWLQNAPTV